MEIEYSMHSPLSSNTIDARHAVPFPMLAADNDSLSIYLQQIRKIPFLDSEREMLLALRYRRTGETDAGGELIVAHLRLVLKIAFECYRHYRISIVDLIQEGNLGLIQAVQRFDPLRGVRLSSYAAYWIKACMLSFVMQNWRIVKIGTSQYEKKLFFNLRKEQARLEKMGLYAGPAQLAVTLVEPEKKIVEMQQRLGSSEVPFDAPQHHDRRVTCGECLAAPGASLDEHIAGRELNAMIREKLSEFKQGLNERERVVLECRMLAEAPLTLNVVSRQFGVSKERIRQIETNIKCKVRIYLQKHVPELEEYAQA